MKIQIFLFYFLMFILVFSAYSQKVNDEYRVVPFTQKDRDILIELKIKVDEMEKRNEQRFNEMEKRNEQRFNEMEKRNEQRFNEMDKRIDDLRDLILWIGGTTVTLIVALFGYIIWDRRTFMKPIERDVEQIKIKTELLEKHHQTNESFWRALKELAMTDEKLKQILKQYNLL